MTPDELRARVAEFMENNDLHDDGEHTCGYSHDLLGHNLESLCREMIAEGIKLSCHAIRMELLPKLDECEQEALMLKDGADWKKPNG